MTKKKPSPANGKKRKASAINASDIVNGLRLLLEREFAHHDLNKKESQIALRIFLGQSGNLIAKRLYITPSCVRYHITKIYEKTCAKNREDFLNTMWKGVSDSETSWDNPREIRRDRDMLMRDAV